MKPTGTKALGRFSPPFVLAHMSNRDRICKECYDSGSESDSSQQLYDSDSLSIPLMSLLVFLSSEMPLMRPNYMLNNIFGACSLVSVSRFSDSDL